MESYFKNFYHPGSLCMLSQAYLKPIFKGFLRHFPIELSMIAVNSFIVNLSCLNHWAEVFTVTGLPDLKQFLGTR